MKKILALLFIMVTTPFVVTSGKSDTPTEFKASITKLQNEANSLNNQIKNYNEKKY